LRAGGRPPVVNRTAAHGFIGPCLIPTRMANLASFDITSGVDLQEVDNAVNQARKEIAQRYDFKGSRAAIDLNRTENTLTLTADDEFKMNAVWEILQGRMVRRGVPTKNLTPGEIERAANDTVRRVISMQQGVPTEAAKDIVKFLKDNKLKKVQAAIQADQVRVSSPSKDELQEAMRLLREHDFGVALQFGNYRG
jgi:cyclic-di-GMP-binding protein